MRQRERERGGGRGERGGAEWENRESNLPIILYIN